MSNRRTNNLKLKPNEVDNQIVELQTDFSENFFKGICYQAEIIKHFDLNFFTIVRNTSYDAFDLNAYYYGLAELETFS